MRCWPLFQIVQSSVDLMDAADDYPENPKWLLLVHFESFGKLEETGKQKRRRKNG